MLSLQRDVVSFDPSRSIKISARPVDNRNFLGSIAFSANYVSSAKPRPIPVTTSMRLLPLSGPKNQLTWLNRLKALFRMVSLPPHAYEIQNVNRPFCRRKCNRCFGIKYSYHPHTHTGGGGGRLLLIMRYCSRNHRSRDHTPVMTTDLPTLPLAQNKRSFQFIYVPCARNNWVLRVEKENESNLFYCATICDVFLSYCVSLKKKHNRSGLYMVLFCTVTFYRNTSPLGDSNRRGGGGGEHFYQVHAILFNGSCACLWHDLYAVDRPLKSSYL